MTTVTQNSIYASVMNKVSFKRCAQFVIFVNVLIVMLVIIKTGNLLSLPSAPISFVEIVAFSLNCYIYLGYLKYALVIHEGKLRLILSIILCIQIFGFIANRSGNAYLFNIDGYFNVGSLIFLLMFFGLRMVSNDDTYFLRRISMLYLLFFVFDILVCNRKILLYLLQLEFPIQPIVIVPLILSAVYTIPALIYWEFKLFNHLHSQYEVNQLSHERSSFAA